MLGREVEKEMNDLVRCSTNYLGNGQVKKKNSIKN